MDNFKAAYTKDTIRTYGLVAAALQLTKDKEAAASLWTETSQGIITPAQGDALTKLFVDMATVHICKNGTPSFGYQADLACSLNGGIYV
jgi:hypothetical protein